jgi:hypothetical protein
MAWPVSGASPSPVTRRRMPSSTPPGMSMEMVLRSLTAPSPEQVEQELPRGMAKPEPPQDVQVADIWKPPTAGLAFCALCTLLEAGAGTCAAFYERVDVDFLLHASRGVEEGDVGLHFDVVAHEDFLLEWVSSSAAAPSLLSSEGAEQVFEVYVLESALEPSCTLCATKSTEATKASSCEWITSSWPAGACSWVEAAIRVER